MTITKHTHVVVSDSARNLLATQVASGAYVATRKRPPSWMYEYLDSEAYLHATPDERLDLAAEAFQRQMDDRAKRRAELAAKQMKAEGLDTYGSQAAAAALRKAAQPARQVLTHPAQRARPGTSWVPCRNGCGQLIRHSRPASIRCGTCPKTNHNPVTD